VAYREAGSFTHDGVEYSLRKALELADAVPVRQYPVSKLKWVLAYDGPTQARVEKADLRAPVLLAYDQKRRLTVVDGLHRLAKAVESGRRSLLGRFLSKRVLSKAREVKESSSMKIDLTEWRQLSGISGEVLTESAESLRREWQDLLRAAHGKFESLDPEDFIALYRKAAREGLVGPVELPNSAQGMGRALDWDNWVRSEQRYQGGSRVWYTVEISPSLSYQLTRLSLSYGGAYEWGLSRSVRATGMYADHPQFRKPTVYSVGPSFRAGADIDRREDASLIASTLANVRKDLKKRLFSSNWNTFVAMYNNMASAFGE